MAARHGRHGPSWQPALAHACVHSAGLGSLHTFPHELAQAPPWHVRPHSCLPQGSARPQGERQAKSAGAEQAACTSEWPPTQRRCTRTSQGGQAVVLVTPAPEYAAFVPKSAPGATAMAAAPPESWHGAVHAWPHRSCARPQGCTQGGQGPAWHKCGARALCRQSAGALQRSEQGGVPAARSRPQATATVVPPQAQATVRIRGQGWQSPAWQKASHTQFPQASARPHASRQGAQSSPPAQQRFLHAWRPHPLKSGHRRSHKSCPSRHRPRKLLERPQRQEPSATASHAPHAPSWQRSAHVCMPHAMRRPQVSPQPGASASQARPGYTRLPHGHVRLPAALAAAVAQGAQGPLWHSRVQRHRPQSSRRPQAAPQE